MYCIFIVYKKYIFFHTCLAMLIMLILFSSDNNVQHETCFMTNLIFYAYFDASIDFDMVACFVLLKIQNSLVPSE